MHVIGAVGRNFNDADTYESLLKQKVLPELKKLEGYRGGYVLRNDGPREVEFVVVNLFDSLDAVKRFAGDNHTTAVFEPEATRLLSRIEPRATHYDVRANTVAVETLKPSSFKDTDL
ncbi:MAG: antibiotic biosynthesis monooxygenase [Acidobacteria bacterium]|nr:MAG: antibiotic biosynthesis monooxygenase [Acidobacteriota bacterium]